MSAKKSEMVSVLGSVFEIVKAIWNAVLELGGTDDDMRNVLRQKDLAKDLALVILGRADVVLKKAKEYIIDLDAPLRMLDDLTLLPDAEQLPLRVSGKVKFDPTKVSLHLDKRQGNGLWINGNKLRKKLENVSVYGAQYGEFLYANQHLIPEGWKEAKTIFFWGSIFRSSSGNYFVSCLSFGGSQWYWSNRWLGKDWNELNPAAVRVSL